MEERIDILYFQVVSPHLPGFNFCAFLGGWGFLPCEVQLDDGIAPVFGASNSGPKPPKSHGLKFPWENDMFGESHLQREGLCLYHFISI